MNWRSTLTAVLVVGAVGFTAGRVFSDEAEGKKMPGKDEMKALMAEMARPVEQHTKLAADAGTWDADVTMWMPGEAPVLSKGVSTTKSILGGLWLHDEFKGEFDGNAFEGGTVLGFSKDKQKFFGLWVSSMGTNPEVVWGTADASGKVVTFDGEPMQCPMGMYTPRWVCRHVDADHKTFEHWSKMEGTADYVKGLEIKYTRRK